MKEIALPLLMIRGDTVALAGPIDGEIEENIDFSLVKAQPLEKMEI